VGYFSEGASLQERYCGGGVRGMLLKAGGMEHRALRSSITM